MNENILNDGELDYRAMFEALSKRANAMLAAHEEYLFLIGEISSKSNVTSLVNKNLFQFKISDQIKLLRTTHQMVIVAEELCQKYDLSE